MNLTDDELVILDGKCSQAVQEKVNEAKDRISARAAFSNLDPRLAGLVADVVTEAKKNLKLVFYHESIRHCSICGKRGDYVKYKSGPRKGRNNWDKPTYLPGREFKHSFVTIKGHVSVGGCTECVEKALPYIAKALEYVKAEIPEAISGKPKEWIRYSNMKCSLCHWEGLEGSMGKLPAMMGGYYFGECPQCKAKNQLFQTNIKTVDGYGLLPASPTNTEEKE